MCIRDRVESARKNLHNDEIWVGELKSIETDCKYDVVYCVRTSTALNK